MLAADQGHVEVMRLLLNNKANANVLEKVCLHHSVVCDVCVQSLK